MNEHTRQDMGVSDIGQLVRMGGSDMGRLEFIDCPLCAGHEKIGADTAEALYMAIPLGCTLAAQMPVRSIFRTDVFSAAVRDVAGNSIRWR